MSAWDYYAPGRKNFTAEGAVGTSDGSGKLKPVRVFFVSLVAEAGSSGTVTLYDGNSTSGTPQLRVHALASSQGTEDISWGLPFPSGCYAGTAGGGLKFSITYQEEVF